LILLAFGDQDLKQGKPVSFSSGFLVVEGMSPLAIAGEGKTYAFWEKQDNSPNAVTVQDWDLKKKGDHIQLAECKGHTDEPRCAVFSLDGKLLVTGSADKTTRIWEAASGKEKYILEGHTDCIFAVAISPDGKLVATASKDGHIKLWDASSGKERASLKPQTIARCLAFSPDGRTLASGGEGQEVQIWDVGIGKELNTLQGHKDTVLAVGFSRDGSLLASAGQDKTIRLWKKQK
jgi:WD40 repeat protein